MKTTKNRTTEKLQAQIRFLRYTLDLAEDNLEGCRKNLVQAEFQLSKKDNENIALRTEIQKLNEMIDTNGQGEG